LAIVIGGAVAATVDVATGAAVAADDDNAVSAVVPPSLTVDNDAYVSTLVAFKGACIGAFADGAGPLGNDDNVESAVGKGGSGGSSAPWGTRTVAAPVNLIVAGNAIDVAIIVVVVVAVSRDLAAQSGVGAAVPPLSLSLPTSSAVAALFPLLNVRHSTLHHPTPTLRGARPISPSLSSRPRLPHYLPLPLPTLVDC
jgi:hypothetical protein